MNIKIKSSCARISKSGFSAAKLLHDLGALVTVNDGKPFAENPEAQDLLALGVKVITGSHPIELLDEGFHLWSKILGFLMISLLSKSDREKYPNHYGSRVSLQNFGSTDHWDHWNEWKDHDHYDDR